MLSPTVCLSGQRGFRYASKIARLSRIGIRAGRFLWSVFVAMDALIPGQVATVPMTLATNWRSSSVVSSSALSGSVPRSSVAPFAYTPLAARAAASELTSIVTARSSTNKRSLGVTGSYSR